MTENTDDDSEIIKAEFADEGEPSAGEGHFVSATMWEYIEPLERGERYEDPLGEVLESRQLGEITGGGTQVSDECGIEFVDIDIRLNNLHEALDLVQKVLEARGATKGSVLRYDDASGQRVSRETGVTECLAIFLDGNSLPAEVYTENDPNDLIEQLHAQLGESDEMRAYWEGPVETALFFFGPDAEALLTRMEPVLHAFPLCQNARVVVRHGKAELNPRTVRIPRQG